MTRREAVRVGLFERAWLRGFGGGVRCAVVDLSAAGALLSLTARLPIAPLRLEFQVGGETLTLSVEAQRAEAGRHVAVAFVDPPSEQLHRLIAAEQRMALAAGRMNVHERRSRRPGTPPDSEPGAPAGRRAGD